MENKKSKELIKKYLDGTCSDEEKAILESWYLAESIEKKDTEIRSVDFFGIEKEIWNKIKRKSSKPIWYKAAAVFAAFITLGAYLFYTNYSPQQIAKDQHKIMPGDNKAILTLSDGSMIDLNDASYGILADESGIKVTKTADGKLVYEIGTQASSAAMAYNTIQTPSGGQYQVNLPDGTKVWLNASSSLKFPTSFSGSERMVEIMGEAYFEVAHNKEKPFKVKAENQTIEVLGTHFNVNAYSDEPMVKTSLLEGSVKVYSLGNATVIRPGEQVVLHKANSSITVQKANVEGDAAWKNGYFHFDNENIESIMRKISRWYNVEIIYQDKVVNQKFVGGISKFEDVSKVLKMLELTGTIRFKVEERRIFVMP